LSKSPKLIAILCSRLDLPGGIERAITNLANLLKEKGNSVTLIVLDETKESFFPIATGIKLDQYYLIFGITDQGNILTRKSALIADTLKLKKILADINPDLVIATEYPFAIAAILSGSRKISKVIAWEHHHFHELKRSFVWEKLFRLTYPRMDAVVCLNDDEKKIYTQLNPRSIVIPNFIRTGIHKAALVNKTILTIARLTHVKGIDLLLQTAKLILQKHIDWKWKIIGDGEMGKEVKDFIQKESLGNHLIIQKPVDHNIQKEYLEASMYVMTSRNECFPMTLLEAMSNGVPCIAFDCETGPRHIIRQNEDGIVVEKENPLKLAEAISSLINDEERRKKMGEKAFGNIQRFSPEKNYELWRGVF